MGLLERLRNTDLLDDYARIEAADAIEALIKERDKLQEHVNQWARGNVVRERESLTDFIRITELVKTLEEIQKLVRTPSNGRHAYTHFMSDFDAIRKLCATALAAAKGRI